MIRVVEKPVTDSTNDDVKALAEAGAPHLSVVWAHRQDAGRGRHGSKWVSREGNVFWSILLRPQKTWSKFTDITFVASVAVHTCIRDVCGQNTNVEIKWPNDILVEGKKVAGILIETGGAFLTSQPEWIVVGIGINVTSSPTLTSGTYPASCLHELGYEDADREKLVNLLNKQMVTELGLWVDYGFEGVRRRYEAVAHRIGEVVTVSQDASKTGYVTGIYQGITTDGEMIVDCDQGQRVLIASGTVMLR